MEVLNDLLGYKSRKIYQNTDWFSFTLDSVLLSNFVSINKTCKKILDIGTGTGVIPLILSLKTSALIDAIEIQKNVALMCKKSIDYNKLNKKINVVNEDVSKYYLEYNNFYDLIISNPPYFKNQKSNEKKEKSISRHEDSLDLDTLIKVSRKMLKNKGKLAIVYNSDRFLEVITKLNLNNLIPKRVRFVHEDLTKKSSMVLIECIKDGNDGLIIEAPFVLYDSNHIESDEYSLILSGGVNNESKKL